jgi:hypothetical protein
MWRADGSGRPRIPEGDPDPVPYKPLWGEVEVNPAKRNAEKEMLRASESIEKKGFIINGISKYIQYWRSGMARNARYAAEMSCFVEYWERIHREIIGPLPIQPDNLQEGFWPMSDWRRDHARRCSTENGPAYSADNSPEDDPEPYPFCGPAKDRPRPNFNPYRDVLLGDFVLCRPSHNNHLPVWLGRALTCVDNTPGDNYSRFTVEWWTPMKGKWEGKRALARECWTRRWEKELTLPEIIHCSIVLFSHRLPSHRKSGPPAMHVIPEASAAAAMATLATHGVAVDVEED